MKEELKVERQESCLRLMDINSVEKDVSYCGRRAEACQVLFLEDLWSQRSLRSGQIRCIV